MLFFFPDKLEDKASIFVKNFIKVIGITLPKELQELLDQPAIDVMPWENFGE